MVAPARLVVPALSVPLMLNCLLTATNFEETVAFKVVDRRDAANTVTLTVLLVAFAWVSLPSYAVR